MTLDLAILRLSGELAGYASVRQGVIAENIANADTPGYRGRDLLPFAEAYAEAARSPLDAPRTRPGHLDLARPGALRFGVIDSAAPGTLSPNGNTVALEDQMLRSAELKLQHDMAVAVYAKSLSILRAGLGRR
jgi:flagellar basal-body rod protein FlgB